MNDEGLTDNYNQDIKIFLFWKKMPDYGWSGSLTTSAMPD